MSMAAKLRCASKNAVQIEHGTDESRSEDGWLQNYKANDRSDQVSRLRNINKLCTNLRASTSHAMVVSRRHLRVI